VVGEVISIVVHSSGQLRPVTVGAVYRVNIDSFVHSLARTELGPGSYVRGFTRESNNTARTKLRMYHKSG